MKKIFIVVFVGIFIMSQLCKSYGSIEAEIEKTHGDLVGSSGNKNTHKSDSISMSYDNVTNTIIIANDGGDKKAVDTQSCTDAVDVRFYEAVPGGVKLCLTSSDGRTPATYYNIENGASGYAIPAMNLPSGIYQVTMIQNGNVTGIKKFVK
ncbi:hypothetical protein [Xylanibacter rodentium]|uniref:hypothetical protein n=2 Tax=Xylanibacter rodentium TaxID=2736289 RepID=UPI0025962790|nr:hypothetical protein [Xylanibacter rodentium]